MNTILKTPQSLSIVSAVLLAGAVLCPSAQAQILGFDVDFNGSDSTYTDNFKRENDADPTGFTWGAAVGTGGTGGLEVTNTGANNIFYRPSAGNGFPGSDTTSTFDFSNLAAGSTFTATTDLLWSSTTATNLTVLTAGFVTANTSQSALTSTGALAGSIIRNGTSIVTLRMRNGNANAQTLDFNQSTLTAGEWYRLSYDLTKTATTNVFDYTVSLFSIGADGTSTPVLFNDGTQDITISGTASNSSIYGDSAAFFAYDIRNLSSNGISNVDNFAVVVPEPASGSLMAIGLVMLALFLRRRRHA